MIDGATQVAKTLCKFEILYGDVVRLEDSLGLSIFFFTYYIFNVQSRLSRIVVVDVVVAVRSIWFYNGIFTEMTCLHVD